MRGLASVKANVDALMQLIQTNAELEERAAERRRVSRGAGRCVPAEAGAGRAELL